MLRIKAIAPLYLSEEEVVRRQYRYERLGGDMVKITVVNLSQHAPQQLNSPEDIVASEQYVREEIARTNAEEFDAILPDCVLDPAVGRIDHAPVPVVGILHLAAGHLASLGESFAAVTRNGAIGNELQRKIDEYGLNNYLTSVELLNVDFCLVSDQTGWASAMEPLVSSLSSRGVTRLLNGCSAVDVSDRRLGSVVVIDPTELAIRLLGVAHETGFIGEVRMKK